MPEKKTSNLKSGIGMSIENVIGKNVIFNDFDRHHIKFKNTRKIKKAL